MGKLLPILLALVGLGAGTGAGYMLKPAPADEAEGDHGTDEDHAAKVPSDGDPSSDDGHGAADAVDVEYVKLNNQFVVPVVNEARVAALVVMSLTIEVTLGERANVYLMEPKLRDAFLQVMFDHANAGGFRGQFTESSKMGELRSALLEVALRVVGEAVSDVLIIDLVRQDTN